MVPDLRTWRRALTWQSRGAGLPGAAMEGSGLASGLRERTQRSSPPPRFCGAFQAERSLFSSRGGGTGGGKEGGIKPYKGRAPPSAGFFPLQEPEAFWCPIAGDELWERPPPKGEAGRRLVGGDSAGRTRALLHPLRT